MKGKLFTEEQIIAVWKEAEPGVKIADLIRKHGIAEGTYYRWKAKYGGMDVSAAKRLKQMEAETSGSDSRIRQFQQSLIKIVAITSIGTPTTVRDLASKPDS